MIGRLVLPLSLVASTFATLAVLAPGPDVWWIADSQNLIIWDCHDPSAIPTYAVFVTNPNTALIPSETPLIDALDNTACSFDTAANIVVGLPVGTGYTLLLTDPINSTNVIGSSQPFEIKPSGQAYSTVTPTVAAFTTATPTGPNGPSSTNGTSSSNSAASIPNIFASETGLWFKTGALIVLVALGMGTLA